MISKKMKYAIKALIYLARHSTLDQCVRTARIAEDERIPKKFLEQILLELKKHQWVNSVQGSTGGYYLMKPADSIYLSDIYRIFEGPIALLPCASDNFYERCEDCKDESRCKIKKSIRSIRNQTLMAMERVTLKSMS